MPCVHLKELYGLCEKYDLKIAGADLVHIVCRQCGEQEVCPTAMTDGDSVITMPPAGDRSQKPADPASDVSSPGSD